MLWNTADVEHLERLWPYHSAGVIAERIGKSRNAVIGKVHRLRGKGTRIRTKPSRMVQHERPRPKPIPPKRKAPVSLMTKPLQPPRPVIQCPCRLIDLEPGQCKWPYGNPHEDDFYFCGAVADGGNPYCLVHMRIAHHVDPRQERSRQRRAPVVVA